MIMKLTIYKVVYVKGVLWILFSLPSVLLLCSLITEKGETTFSFTWGDS